MMDMMTISMIHMRGGWLKNKEEDCVRHVKNRESNSI